MKGRNNKSKKCKKRAIISIKKETKQQIHKPSATTVSTLETRTKVARDHRRNQMETDKVKQEFHTKNKRHEGRAQQHN